VESAFPSGVLEKWDAGMMGPEEQKIGYDSSLFGTHHSIIPTFHKASTIREVQKIL
jgi:hypothetical protein